ncbi:MAG: hypothetical protein K2Q26_12060, partial [Bdellovibrionales bacterium]|nr:hypothetical protein [Bdellovibrionales bacterium]
MFPCNSIYREDFIQRLCHRTEKDTIEISAAELALPRYKSRLQSLRALALPMIAIIDHVRQDWTTPLKAWDSLIVEYRIIPSRMYTSEDFLTSLPPFVLRKLKWALPAPVDSNLQTINDIQKSFSEPALWNHQWSRTLWNLTWDPSSSNGETVGKLFYILESQQKPGWPMLLGQSSAEYVGVLNPRTPVPHIESALSEVDIVFYQQPAMFQQHQLLPLHDFAIHKQIWNIYLTSEISVDVFSWNDFIKKYSLRVVIAEGADVSSLTTDKISEHAKISYIAQPRESFFREWFFWLGHSPRRRQFLLWFFTIYFKVAGVLHPFISWIPRGLLRLKNEIRSVYATVFSDFIDSLEPMNFYAVRGFLKELTRFPPEWQALPTRQRLS